MLLSRGSGPNYVENSTNSVKCVYDVGHFDFVTLMLFMGSDTGSDTDVSPHINPQIDVFTKEAICRVYQQKFGHIIQRIL